MDLILISHSRHELLSPPLVSAKKDSSPGPASLVLTRISAFCDIGITDGTLPLIVHSSGLATST